jgi:Tfp pilus assembly protein PilO
MSASAKKSGMSPKTLSILIGAAGLLVLLAGFFFLVRPQSHKAANLTEEITKTQAQIVTARSLATQKPEQTIRVADLFKVVEAMPDDPDMTGIILQLQQTANEAGVKFDSIQPQPLDTTSSYGLQSIDLAFRGNYYSLTDFLFRLRRLVTVHGGTLDATGRLFSVGRIDFAPGADGFPQITANVTVNAYVFSPVVALPPGVPPLTKTTTTDSGTDALAGGVTP